MAKLLAVQTWANSSPVTHVVVVQLRHGKLVQSHTVAHGPSGVEFSSDGRELFALGCCWTGSGSTLVAWDALPGGNCSASATASAPRRSTSHPILAGWPSVSPADDSFVLDARSGRRIGQPYAGRRGRGLTGLVLPR